MRSDCISSCSLLIFLLCLYNKLKNTGDMMGIVHTFYKHIRL